MDIPNSCDVYFRNLNISCNVHISSHNNCQVLVNLFNSALATTPSDATSLTLLAKWILSCITFVFIALLFYVVILVDAKKRDKNKDTKVSLDNAQSRSDAKTGIDLDPLFLVVHLLSFTLFALACAFTYLI